jgi:alpha-L-rhamnosidase
MKSFTFILTFILLSCFTFAKTVVVDPVVEYKVNPVGIDVMRPRLSWKLVSGKRNVMQTAYEIRVASTVAELSNKNKQLWNSGRVESDRSVNVPYEGPALKSMQRVYWQVRVWDNKDDTSNWSEPAYWETGILEPELWKAEWITLPDEVDIKGSKPAHYYRKEFSLLKKIKSARVYVTSLGLYELFINGRKVSDDLFTPGWTSYTKRLQYQTYDVTSMLVQNNAIGAIVGDGWYRGFLAWAGRNNYYGDKIALLCQLHIIYSDGSSETIVTDGTWKVNNGPIRESDIYNGELYDARFEMEGWNSSGFDDNKWRNAVKI